MTQVRQAPKLVAADRLVDVRLDDSVGAGRWLTVPSPPTRGDGEHDVAILRRVRAADTSALDVLLREYWCPLVSYVARLLPSEDQAQDVVQEVFIRLWDGRAQLEVGQPMRPLLYRIARNLALNERRSERVRERWRRAGAVAPTPRVPTPLHSSILAELELAIERALEGLPARRREAFVLARFHEMSHRQIADVMGVSVQTVANQISGALADLRLALAPYLSAERSDGA
jgi:RNA polymerase sigma-70 factor (ECF subfamily)